MGKDVSIQTEVTKDEMQIVEYIADGYSVNEIAEKKKAERKTVQATIDRLKIQFRCSNVANLAATFIRKKIIE